MVTPRLKLVRDPHWFTIGAHRVTLSRTMGRRMGFASGCFHSKFRTRGRKTFGWLSPREFISHAHLQPVGPINTNLMLGYIVTFNEHCKTMHCIAMSTIVLRPLLRSWHIGPLFRGQSLFPAVIQLLRRSNHRQNRAILAAICDGRVESVFVADKSYRRRLDGLVGLLAQL